MSWKRDGKEAGKKVKWRNVLEGQQMVGERSSTDVPVGLGRYVADEQNKKGQG